MQVNKEISPYKHQLRQRIIEKAMEAFSQKGIKAVKMDDVAGELCISKRTLYEVFEKKEQLIYEGIVYYHNVFQKRIAEKISHCQNVIEVIIAIYRMKVEEFQKTNPQFLTDLTKYPDVARYFNQTSKSIRKEAVRFMERGVVEGYFRDDVNNEMVVIVFEALNKYVMDNELYREYSIEEVFWNMVLVPLRGMCTEKGLEALSKIA